MIDELYIDNTPVDMDNDTNVTLNYKNNIFTDLSKIVSNNTYSIKLPMTVHNCKVISQAHLPSCVTTYPYINHKGRYLRNGIEIVSDASASIVEVSDTIDVALAWGNVTRLADIVNEDRSLRDLGHAFEEGVDYIVWKKQDANSALYPYIDYGFKTGEENTWYHPAVSVKWILDRMAFFDFPDSVSDELSSWIIPLITRNDSPLQSQVLAMNFTITSIQVTAILGGNGKYGGHLKMGTLDSTTNYYGHLSDENYNYVPFKDNAIMYISANITVDIKVKDGSPLTNARFVCLGYGSSEILAEAEYTDMTSLGGGTYRVIFRFDDLEVTPDRTLDRLQQYISFFITTEPGLLGSTDIVTWTYNSTLTIRSELEEVCIRPSDFESDDRFYFIPNLPDIKQIDFIKTIAAMLGMFAVPGEKGHVKFIPLNDVILNKSKAYDWTKRVVASYPENRPKTTSYSLDNFAQRNYYRWKDDEDNRYVGYLSVGSAVMEYERDVLTAPFAPSDKRGGVAYIPLYSYDSDGNLEYDSGLTPRILRLDGVKGTFDGLSWDTLLRTNYQAFSKILQRPRVITELIEIRDFELRDLDMTIPCYLAQYGKYYAIISIKAEKTGICECKLYQLD